MKLSLNPLRKLKLRELIIFMFLIVLCLNIKANNQLLIENGNELFIDITKKGAIGDSSFDNHEIIQKVIDSLSFNGGGTIFFPSGVYAIYDESLAIWGNNIKLQGESVLNTTIVKKGKVGFFGDCIDICGKIKGYQYVGDFGKGDYDRRSVYKGKTIKSDNIRLNGLTISTDLKEKSNVANGLGILNSTNVKVTNCKIINSPQTNLAIVNETFRFSNGLVKFENCIFENSGRHNVRVISYNKGGIIGNKIEFYKCKFICTKNTDDQVKELVGKKVLFWYRGGVKNGLTEVKIDQCYFDDSGLIFANCNTNGLSITNSEIHSALQIQHSPSFSYNPKIKIQNNSFLLNKNFESELVKEKFLINKNLYVYPKNIKSKSNNIQIMNNNFL